MMYPPKKCSSDRPDDSARSGGGMVCPRRQTEEAALRFEKACEKKARELQKKDDKLSEYKAEQQAEETVRNSVGTSYKSEWIKLMWQGYYEEADDIQSALRDVSDAFDNSYFRTWAKKLKELMREYSSYEEYEESK